MLAVSNVTLAKKVEKVEKMVVSLKLAQKGGKSREHCSFSRISEGTFGSFWALFFPFSSEDESEMI